MNKKSTLSLLAFIYFLNSIAQDQQPAYTHKHFVSKLDTTEFKIIRPQSDGFSQTFVLSHEFLYFDIDDDSTTFVTAVGPKVVNFEGYIKNGKRNGIFTAYLIDSINHHKRYKVYEQEYANDKLNGHWRIYTLHGTLYSDESFTNDSTNGPFIHYWIDGRTPIDETDYVNGHNEFTGKDFYKNGNVKEVLHFKNQQRNGPAMDYYEDGHIEAKSFFKNDLLDDTAFEFYSNGQVKMKDLYKDGKNWTKIASFTGNGLKRDGGTLKDGNGTEIDYYDNGNMQRTGTFKNGLLTDTFRYYYPNGQIWIEEIYKEGKHWTVVANYTDKGERREAGSLKNGNGSLVLYNEDGTVRETEMYINGQQINN